MRADLDSALVRDFPMLYDDRRAPMTRTCMCWGFECGDGWEPLIRRLSEKLEPLIAALPEPRPRASQVKEKFGTLRFYMTDETPEMSAAISAACEESCRTCEQCGAPGIRRNGGWIRVLCENCNAA